MISNPKYILIIKWGALGDMIMGTSAIRSVKETFPRAKVFLLGNSLMQQIVPPGSIVDQMIIYDEKKYKGWRSVIQLFKLILFLRKYKFDIAINLRWHSDRCAMITYLCGAKVRVSSGPRNMMKLYTEKVPFPKGRYHEVLRNLDIVRAIGVFVKDETPYTYISELDHKFALEFFEAHSLSKKNTICIHPGASKPIRAWLPDRYKEIAKMIVDKYNLNVVITWSGKEKDMANFIALANSEKIFVAPETISIGELAAIIKNCGMCLTNCTGPMNVAVAVRTPTCAILGSSDPDDWRPYGEIHRTIKSPLVRETYTDEQEVEAMKAISVEQVWETVNTRINEIFDIK